MIYLNRFFVLEMRRLGYQRFLFLTSENPNERLQCVVVVDAAC